MAAINPAPRRQRVSVFPTPDIRDLLFYERVDTKLPQWSVAPAYGSPHPDALKYPNHRLCYIKPAGDGGELGWQDWFYAAERADQDLYNFEYTKADLGGNKFDAVRRTYVSLRENFSDINHNIGESMPDIPSGIFTGSYTLSEYSQQRIGDRELDGQFIVETLTFVKRCVSSTVKYDEDSDTNLLTESNLYAATDVVPGAVAPNETAAELFADEDNAFWGQQSDGSIREGRQLSCDWYEIIVSQQPISKPRISVYPTPNQTDIIFYERVNSRFAPWDTPPTYGDPHPDTANFPDHKFCYVRPSGELGWQDWFYAADRQNQDAYNFEYTQADIGGTKFDAVRRTYVTPRSVIGVFNNPIGSLMVDDFNGNFPGEYILAEYSQKRIDERELDSLFVLEVLTFVKRCVNSVCRYDEETGASLGAQSNLYYKNEVVPGSTAPTDTAAELFAAPTNIFWGLQTTGIVREGRQLSCNWYEITETRVVPNNAVTTITGGSATAIPIRSYFTEDDYSWPASLVVSDIIFKSITMKNKDGTTYTRTYPRTDFATPAYRGPTKAKVEQWWSKTAIPEANLPQSKKLLAREIEYTGANYSLKIEPTLHAGFTLVDVIGSSDPNFVAATYSETFNATNEPTRPASLIATVDQRPFRGGYRITVITAYAP